MYMLIKYIIVVFKYILFILILYLTQRDVLYEKNNASSRIIKGDKVLVFITQ
jgi:hypothetical protein